MTLCELVFRVTNPRKKGKSEICRVVLERKSVFHTNRNVVDFLSHRMFILVRDIEIGDFAEMVLLDLTLSFVMLHTRSSHFADLNKLLVSSVSCTNLHSMNTSVSLGLFPHHPQFWKVRKQLSTNEAWFADLAFCNFLASGLLVIIGRRGDKGEIGTYCVFEVSSFCSIAETRASISRSWCKNPTSRFVGCRFTSTCLPGSLKSYKSMLGFENLYRVIHTLISGSDLSIQHLKKEKLELRIKLFIKRIIGPDCPENWSFGIISWQISRQMQHASLNLLHFRCCWLWFSKTLREFLDFIYTDVPNPNLFDGKLVPDFRHWIHAIQISSLIIDADLKESLENTRCLKKRSMVSEGY